MTDGPADKAGTEGEKAIVVEGGRASADVLVVLQDLPGRPSRSDDTDGTGWLLGGPDLAELRAKIRNEVVRHEAGVFNSTGDETAAPFDLGDIRSRIGRRLDRIRDTRGAG